MWLSEHEFSPGVVMGRMDTMALMREARESFVDGHYIATLVLASAFIEHTLGKLCKTPSVVCLM